MNPFTVGVVQGIVGLPLFSRIGFRVVLWTATTTVTIIFLSRCAARVKADPGISLMREFDLKREDHGSYRFFSSGWPWAWLR